MVCTKSVDFKKHFHNKTIVFLIFVFLLALARGPVFACANPCANDGDKQCGTLGSYVGYQTCDYSYNDSCLEWSGLNVCPTGQTCTSGACVAIPQICVPGAVSVCKVCNAAGTVWADDSSKCTSGKVCQNDACVAGSQLCTPGAVLACKVCNAAGTAWADDSSKCTSGQICQNGACVSSGCAATTCLALGHSCGSWGDGCGGTLSCGTCTTGQTCNNGTCAAQTNAAPTIDLKVNGVDGPLSITEGGSIVLSWTSTNAASCAVFGAWSGTQPTSGLVATKAVVGNNTYSIVCSGTAGTATDSVVVDAGSNTPVLTVSSQLQVMSGRSITLPASIENAGNSISYSWFCSSGTLSSSTVLAPLYTAPVVSREIDANCTLSMHDGNGHSAGKSIQIMIEPPGTTVQATTPQTTVQATANQPASTLTRAQILAKIVQIQALIAALQKQLAALNAPVVVTTGNGVLSVVMQIGNVTQSLPFAKSVYAHAGNALTFKIIVSDSASGTFARVTLSNILPAAMGAPQNIKINGVATSGTFAQGLDIGGFTAGMNKTITFTAVVSQSASYQTLTDTATAASGSVLAHDSVSIIIN